MGTTRQKSSCRNRLQNGPRLLSRVKAGTHSPSPTGSHTAAYTPKQGPSGQGRYHYPRRIPHVHEHPRAGYQNGVLCRFGILAGRCSRRTQRACGAAMRLCASLFRGVAAPPGCVTLLLTSFCFQGVTSGGGGDRREHVPAPDRADIGVAAAHLPTEIGDGIRHDLYPHGPGRVRVLSGLRHCLK